MVVNKTKTDKMGSYTFQDLEPGTYAVYCKRDALMSEATKQTAVKAGDTITLDLDLMLR